MVETGLATSLERAEECYVSREKDTTCTCKYAWSTCVTLRLHHSVETCDDETLSVIMTAVAHSLF